ncbi:DUF1345 domain-containing protein [Sphingomonas sp.]|jgi:uncharacterized membrane protein|uniref:DUF1345 domain-containing protein n=1 Tax=Sphingomonas sp. TaxID=28214 RepID=UPI002E335DE4|nr:DUF1345 domain-containing protein [Sphingomonas sp.]HEX4693053.1 DUF1345 domain-containing protein [Sphingomonas sp.]
MAMNLGKRIAPPRFVLFVVVLAVGLAVAVPRLGWGRGTLAGFDVASAVFLVAMLQLFLRKHSTAQMRRAAAENDANRVGLLVITAVTTLVVLVAVGNELHEKNNALAIALVIGSLILAWLFSNTVYALHYAHLYYSDCDGDGDTSGGLDFPGRDAPDYWDFLYFSFTLGMTFQTSDIDIPSRRIRFISLGQCLAAFVFNLGVLAFTINTIGG